MAIPKDSLKPTTPDFDKDPLALRGLAQALYVCESLCRGDSLEELVARFQGDAQLVEMWINFLRHNGWLECDITTQRWSMTRKGRSHALGITDDNYKKTLNDATNGGNNSHF